MKKMLCGLAFLILAAQLPLWSYDQSPYYLQVVPEAIWAAATGGGTWVTEIQITMIGSGTADLYGYFYYNGGQRGPFLLYDGLEQYNSLRYTNFLAKMRALDGSFEYYGRVGPLEIFDVYVNPIAVQAKIVNGNYGKTLPALSYASAANSIAVTRPMFIQDLAQDLTYRTSVGIFNGSTVTTYTLRFTIVNANNVKVGADFEKTIGPYGFMSFNPFAEAGVPSGLYNNCWLAISATAGDSAVPGVFCYASGANNYTNDTYALIARPRN